MIEVTFVELLSLNLIIVLTVIGILGYTVVKRRMW